MAQYVVNFGFGPNAIGIYGFGVPEEQCEIR